MNARADRATPRRAARPGRSLLGVLAAITLIVAACGGDAGASSRPTDLPPQSTGSGPTDDPAATDAATATPGPAATTVAEGLSRGPWRRQAFDARGEITTRIDATCRAAEPAIGDLPVALIDARGQERLTVIYASGMTSAAWECRADIDATTAAEVVVVKLQDSGTAIADDEIDTVQYEIVDLDGTDAIVLVGRVGQAAAYVINGFPNETYIFGSHDNGWYAMWWPGTEPMDGVSSTDGAHAVIGDSNPTFTP